jgi:hypothetical protein
MSTDAWGRATSCPECGDEVPKHPSVGRPRATCSKRACQLAHRRKRHELSKRVVHAKCTSCGESVWVPCRRSCA